MLNSEERAAAGRQEAREGVDAHLAVMTEALDARGFGPVRRNVYRDESGDGTGDMGWLWLRADPPLHPDEPHDCVVRYSEADDNWQVSAPGGRIRQISGTGDPAAVAELVVAESGRGPDLSVPSGAAEVPAVRDVPEWVAMVLGGAATSLVLPFVEALVGKSAEDAYAGLRARLRRRRPSVEPAPASAPIPTPASVPVPAHPAPPAASEYVSVLDPEADLHLVVPDPVPPEALRRLAAMDRAELRGRTLVWDESRGEWFRCRRA
ncbi:hypothetical protein [Streptomyces sp. NPDC014734]|uniref:hypothetical protein n=1 Tax=Streptomyces sp. NPDC014734 TaxID=3364886 RepID=UPI0036F6E333